MLHSTPSGPIRYIVYMAKKKNKNRRGKPREKKDFSQNALFIVERLIGGKLVRKRQSK